MKLLLAREINEVGDKAAWLRLSAGSGKVRVDIRETDTSSNHRDYRRHPQPEPETTVRLSIDMNHGYRKKIQVYLVLQRALQPREVTRRFSESGARSIDCHLHAEIRRNFLA